MYSTLPPEEGSPPYAPSPFDDPQNPISQIANSFGGLSMNTSAGPSSLPSAGRGKEPDANYITTRDLDNLYISYS